MEFIFFNPSKRDWQQRETKRSERLRRALKVHNDWVSMSVRF